MVTLFAAYRGDELIILGTKEQVAEELGVKASSVQFYATPTYKKRAGENGLVIERVDEDDGQMGRHES